MAPAEGQACQCLASIHTLPLFSIDGLEWGQYQAYLLFLKTHTSNKHKTAEAIKVETMKQYKEILEQVGLGVLHTLLIGRTRLKHLLRMVAEWKPREVVRHPTGRMQTPWNWIVVTVHSYITYKNRVASHLGPCNEINIPTS